MMGHWDEDEDVNMFGDEVAEQHLVAASFCAKEPATMKSIWSG